MGDWTSDAPKELTPSHVSVLSSKSYQTEENTPNVLTESTGCHKRKATETRPKAQKSKQITPEQIVVTKKDARKTEELKKDFEKGQLLLTKFKGFKKQGQTRGDVGFNKLKRLTRECHQF